MHSRFVPLGVTGAVLVVAATRSVVVAAPRSDLAVLRIRIPAHVKLSDARPKASAGATVRIANRGALPVVIADAATLAAVVRLSAVNLEGPVACAPVGVTPVVARRRFPQIL